MMLQAYLIGGQSVGVDLQNWRTQDLAGNPAFLYSNTLQNNYADITSITNMYNLGENTDIDFKRNRDYIKGLIIKLGQSFVQGTQGDPLLLTPQDGDAWEIVSGVGLWLGKDGQIAQWVSGDWVYFAGGAGISSQEEFGFSKIQDPGEQKIAASYLIGTVSQQMQAYSLNKEEKSQAQLLYKQQVQSCRLLRYKYVENDFLQEIPQYAAVALSEIGNMGHYYFEQGIDGELYGDVGITGLADWVMGYGAFDGVGLINKNWTSLYGKDMDTYANELNNLLFINGLNNAQQNLVT